MRPRSHRAGAEPGTTDAVSRPGSDAPRTLADLRPGASACIAAVGGPPAIRERLRDLGFVEGERVRMVKTAPLADPAEYCVQGIDVGLRRTEAELIEVRDATGCDCRQRSHRRHGWFGGRRCEDDP